MSKFEIVFTATPEQILRFDPAHFYAVVENRMGALMNRLRSKMSANLHGEVLASRSGRLAQSLSEVNVYREGGDTIVGEISAGAGVPYALAHEMGGAGPYEIIATNKKALRFMVNDKTYFRKMITHGAALKRSYFMSAIDDLERTFVAELTDAAHEAIE